MRYDSNRLNLPILGILLGVALLGGLYGASQFRIPGGPSAIYAAEETYLGSRDAAHAYYTLCAAKTLPASCKGVYNKVIYPAEATADRAYNVVKGHELETAAQQASAFLDAVSTLKAAVPATAGAQ